MSVVIAKVQIILIPFLAKMSDLITFYEEIRVTYQGEVYHGIRVAYQGEMYHGIRVAYQGEVYIWI